MKKQWTKKQHFIPRMILKHHTYFRIPMRKPIIYQYDKEKGICRAVDIYDICRKDNLYEFRNEDGSIKESTRNAIENTLSWYESSWGKIFNKILSHQELTHPDMTYPLSMENDCNVSICILLIFHPKSNVLSLILALSFSYNPSAILQVARIFLHKLNILCLQFRFDKVIYLHFFFLPPFFYNV